MLLKQSMVDALNKQVIEEFSASAQYIAIALHFDSETLPELSKYFHAQATEEHGHAMKLLQYITDAGGHGMALTLVDRRRDHGEFGILLGHCPDACQRLVGGLIVDDHHPDQLLGVVDG